MIDLFEKKLGNCHESNSTLQRDSLSRARYFFLLCIIIQVILMSKKQKNNIWLLMYLFFCFLLIGWAELPFIWVHSMHCSYCRTGLKIRVTRNFAFFWRVCIRNMLFTSLLLLSSVVGLYILNSYWYPSCRVSERSWILWTFFFTWLQLLLFSFFLLHL